MNFSRYLISAALGIAAIGAPSPLIAQVAPPPLEAYGELPTLEDIAISPAGKLAMLATSGGKRLLVVLGADMKPVSAMEVGDIKVRDLEWVGDEMIVIERTDTQDLGERFIAQNAEFGNAMIVQADGGGEVRTVFADDKSILKATFGNFGYRNVGGRWIGYFAGIPMQMGQTGQYYYDGGQPALYAVDMGTNKARRITSAASENENSDWLIDASGNVAATMIFNDKTGAWRLTNAQGRELASGSSLKGGASIISFSADGQKVLYRVTDEHGDTEFFEVPGSGGTPQPVFADSDIDIPFIDSATGRLTGYIPEEGEQGQGRPVFFDPNAQETVGKVIAAFQNVHGTLEDFSPDYTRIILSTAGNNDSGTWYLVDTSAGQASVVGRARPQIRANQVGPISVVQYKAQDGTEIEGILTLPPGRPAKSLPVIIFPHGGPRAHDERTFDWWAQAFASRGYAVLQPNFRGSTGYGDAFMHAGDGEWGRKMQTDLSDGLAYLAEQGIADPKRACIMGGSYGGYAAMAGITLQNGLYRCSVAVAGVSDLGIFLRREYNESGSRELRDGWLEMMGARSNLEEVSPRTFAAKANAPILLIHGRDDTVVPYQQSRIMADALKDAGKPFEFVELEGEDHWLSRSQTRQQMLAAAVKFVLEHNPPD